MSIAVKNSATSVNNTIKKNNLVMGGNPIEYGPTQTTGFYSAKVIPSVGYSGYVIYETNSSGRLRMYEMANDSELITAVKKLGGTTVTTVNDALIWLTSNPNFFVINKPIDNIATNGLVFYLDASQLTSYPKSGSTWYDLSGNGFNSTLLNGATFDTGNGGSIVFDGTNDYGTVGGLSQILLDTTWLIWIKRNGTQVDYSGLLYNRNTIGSGLGINTGNQLSYSWNNASNTWGWNTGLVPPDSAWSMCAVTVSSTQAVMYLCQSSGITSATNNVSHGSVTIDNVRIAYDGLVSRYYKGNMGMALLYNRVLTSNEIQNTFNTTKTRYGL